MSEGSGSAATRALVSFVRGLEGRLLPERVLRQASGAVLDLAGVAIAGAGTPLGRVARRSAAEHFAPGGATVVGSRRRLGVVGATWANGNAASALDLDDGHRLAMGHPGAAVIPAALAVAETTGASGREVLAAIVAGYEVAVRASAARMPAYRDRQYSTGIWGVLGAAVAAGRLLGLDEAGLQSALGTAASHGPFPPAGPLANWAMTKEVIGWAGMTGCAAALLARDGFVGPADVFDYSGRWDTAALVEGLGDPARYAILSAYRKPHAVCRWAHSAIDAVLALCARHGLEAAEVERIRVEAFYEATRIAEPAPRTVVGAQFSLPFALALAVLYRRVGLEEVSEANLEKPDVLELARRVEIATDPELDRQFPAKTVARVTLVTPRGELSETVEYPRGNPENPMTDAELADKFRGLAEPALGETECVALREAILAVPDTPDITGVTRRLAFDMDEEERRG